MFLDGQPRLIPAPHGPDHVVCMLPKVGSTRYEPCNTHIAIIPSLIDRAMLGIG